METNSPFVFSLILFYLLDSSIASSCYDADQSGVCETQGTIIPFLSTRGPGTVVTMEMFKWEYCDVYAISRGQWYLSNMTMANACPDMYMCGTMFPIWLQGEHPGEKEGIVNMTACQRDFGTCCLRTYSLAAVTCGEMFAYCFNELPSECHQRYCFEVSNITLKTTHSISTTTTKTSKNMVSTTVVQSTEFVTTFSPQPTFSTQRKETTTSKMAIISSTSAFTSPVERVTDVTTPTRSEVNSNSNMHSSPTAETNSDTIIILMACLGVLLLTVILLLAVILRYRIRAKEQNDSDKPLDKENDVRMSGTVDGDRDQLTKTYECLKYLDASKYPNAVYATLEEPDNNGIYEMASIVSGDYEIPRTTPEEDHVYQKLPSVYQYKTIL